jgi:membrane fusion protein, multidrug efflux system
MRAKKVNSVLILLLLTGSIVWYGCTQSSGGGGYQQVAQELPVYTVTDITATTYREFPAVVEGTQVVEIRPQVNGYLDKILVDEGDYVRKGQPLFRIDDHIYREQYNNAKANLATAKADLANADIEVSRLTPLVQSNVVSDVKLKAAQATYDAAVAHVAQAEAMLSTSSINLGYASIKAPVDGYIGRIPFKTGSLVSVSNTEALSIISEIKDVYAYFSFSEIDFLEFSEKIRGNSLSEKIGEIPAVELILADNSTYPLKGKVEIVSGQFNNSTGAISMRAKFPNTNGLLRSGITGKIRIPQTIASAVVVPQASTFELQDKVMVFVLDEKNIVNSAPIQVAENYGNFYLVKGGLKPGQRIAYAGIDRLRDGAVIQPQPISADSLLKTNNFNQ